MGLSNSKQRVHPSLWISTLFAAESFPYNAVTLVAVVMYASFGLSDASVTFWTSLLCLPWALKPFFAPLLEMWGTKRSWVILTQFCAGAGFAVTAFALPAPFVVQSTLAMLFIMAFNSAAHDVVADGMYIDALDEAEQSKYVGLQSAFWTIGQVAVQGGLVVFAGSLELTWGVVPAWMGVWLLLAVTMVIFAFFHAFALPVFEAEEAAAKSRAKPTIRLAAANFKEISTDFFLKRQIWWVIAFALLYRTAEGQIERIAMLFMSATVSEGGLGMSTVDVGTVYGVAGTMGMIAGSLLGGWYTSRVGLKRAILPLALIFNVPNALFIYLGFAQPQSLWIVAACVVTEKFAIGMGFTAMLLVLMQRAAPGKHSTTHYGYATALMNVGIILPGMISGQISDAIGYNYFFIYLMFMGLPSILIAKFLPLDGEIRSPEIPEGPAGELLKASGWATTKAAGGLFLLACFVGFAVDSSVSLPMLIGYGVLAAIGCLLSVSAIKTAKRTQSAIIAQGLSMPHQCGRARNLAVIGIILWGISLSHMANRMSDIRNARELCTQDRDASACESVCSNDSDLDACVVYEQSAMQAMEQRIAELATASTSVEAQDHAKNAADTAFGAFRAVREIRCTTQEHVQACNELAQAYWHPDQSLFRAALHDPSHQDAQRYFFNACNLGDEASCELARQVNEEKARGE